MEVRPGEFFTMLGPSGSGKTTTLRVIAGFDQADAGCVELHGVEVTRSAPYERPVNTLFQEYALFPHMSVLDNVAYGLRSRAWVGGMSVQTFRFVALPMIATALVAGGLLAFALSFDEMVVTTFTSGAQSTLPIWIFGNIHPGQQLPQVNVVVLFVILLSLIPVALAQRLTRDTGVLRRVAAPAAAVE